MIPTDTNAGVSRPPVEDCSPVRPGEPGKACSDVPDAECDARSDCAGCPAYPAVKMGRRM